MMHTVARFLAEPALLGKVVDTGEAMNALRPGMFSGLRQRGDGFACDICQDGSWSHHEQAIREFVTEFAALLRTAVDSGIAVAIDIAIEQGDREAATAFVGLGFDPSLLSAIASLGLRLEITSY
jgi:hypothetical protein